MPPTESYPPLTILLVNYNTRELLDDCLGRLMQALQPWPASPVVVVDNDSSDGSPAHLERHWPQVRLIRSGGNLGFGRANNLAVPLLDTPFLLLLNTDAFVAPDTLSAALARMEALPRCGILGVRLTGRDGLPQPDCRHFPTPWNTFLARAGLGRWLPGRPIDDPHWHHDAERECDWVPGCFYLIRREVVEQVGLFDPRFFLYYEEVDHCRRTKAAGWQVWFSPCTEVIHLGGESAGKAGEGLTGQRQIAAVEIESALLYFRKHHGWPGVWLHLVLEHLASAALTLKRWLGRGPSAPPGAERTHLRRLWQTLRATAWGRTATR